MQINNILYRSVQTLIKNVLLNITHELLVRFLNTYNTASVFLDKEAGLKAGHDRFQTRGTVRVWSSDEDKEKRDQEN